MTVWYGSNATAETCSSGTEEFDLVSPIGGSGTVAGAANNASFEKVMAFFHTYGASGPTASNISCGISVNAIDADTSGRFRLERVDNAACTTVLDSSAYSTTFTTTGSKTLTADLSGFTWTASDSLVLATEIQRTANHGNRNITLNIGNTNTFIDDQITADTSDEEAAARAYTEMPPTVAPLFAPSGMRPGRAA